MTTLDRYLLKRNLFLISLCIGIGVGVYLMADIFDRLDNFLDAGVGAGHTLLYFAVKLPLIISQLIPAIFLVAMLIQLSLMAASREILALNAGGVSDRVFIRFFVVYALLWSMLSLTFAQVLGVVGEKKAAEIWAEQVRKREIQKKVLHNLWFKDGPFVIEISRAVPSQHRGEGIVVYEMSEDGKSMLRIYEAPSFDAMESGWVLKDVSILEPKTFKTVKKEKEFLNIEQDLSVFVAFEANTDPATLPLVKLGNVIRRLEKSGSNVEVLRTAWHMQWAYGFSIMVMALWALVLIRFGKNVYLNVVFGLIVTFAYYAVFLLGIALGQKGYLPPFIGAWFGNLALGSVAVLKLLGIRHLGIRKHAV